MKNKVFTFALLLSMIAVAGSWAQNLPGGIWSSPQSTTTEGRYRSNADDFIRPDNYTNLRLNNWFGMVSFLWDGSYSGIATAGFAKKANDVYISAFYSGNFWTWAPINDYTERQFSPNPPNGGAANQTYNVYNKISVVPNPVNNAALLIGVADMGIRLTYRSNHQMFDKNDIVVGSGDDSTKYQLYKSYQAEGGYIAPQIAWAMAKNLTDNGIRPYLTVDLEFHRDYEKTEAVGSTIEIIKDGDDEKQVTVTGGERIGRSLNHFDPSVTVGMGGYTFFNKNGFRGSFDLDYVLSMNFFDNEYSYVEDGQYKTGKIKGTYSSGEFPYVERSYLSNQLTPSLSGQWGADRLALRFKLNLVFGLINSDQNLMNLTGSELIYSDSSSYTTFTFRPDIRLALQYKIVPDKLTLNVGARIQATTLTAGTIVRKTYDNAGEEISVSIKHTNTYGDNSGGGSSFASRFHIGPTFNFTENCWLEAVTGVSSAYGENAIDIFAPGGLFSFGSLMVGLKF
jgi:hypothetical protein